MARFAVTAVFEVGPGKVPRGADRTWPALNREGMFRTPRAGVEFGDVVLTWYANQGETPLVSSRGQLQDHFALSVTDLDAWLDKLRVEGCVLGFLCGGQDWTRTKFETPARGAKPRPAKSGTK